MSQFSTREEIKTGICEALEIDESDLLDDGEQTIGSFIDEEELDEVKEALEDKFNVDVESMDLDTTFTEIMNGFCEHFGIITEPDH